MTRGELEKMKYRFNPSDRTVAVKGSPIDGSFARYELEATAEKSFQDEFVLMEPLNGYRRNVVAVRHKLWDFPLSRQCIEASRIPYPLLIPEITSPQNPNPCLIPRAPSPQDPNCSPSIPAETRPEGYTALPEPASEKDMDELRKQLDREAFTSQE